MQNIKNIRLIQKFGILCGSLFISLFYSCNKLDKKKITSFEVSTSGCYKHCPVLDLKYHNNTVYYHLILNNSKKGFYKYTLTPDEVNSLNYLMHNIPIESLKAEYASNIPDAQVYSTSFVYNNKEKSVLFFENECLKSYQTLVKKLIHFKEKKIIKIDTVIKIETRKRVPFEKIKIPPIVNSIE